ncbi:MAG: ABC transporter ATP-binding protein [Candidatus Fermentithermobacillus carboniphilus]|uniref:ABC transporter ATP-binding protein n=1 Tax=Candidatus Fermentithermobacillus carboniphilus TaxID=3085328 RepID=A0AAT9LAJ1_9FIRM|nr:MAG: ABC transporter ATP-binding protein [Candidatus Fermentithermobacillus carboniphilus]
MEAVHDNRGEQTRDLIQAKKRQDLASSRSTLLSIEDLQVSFHTYAGEVHAVRGVSYSVERGGSLAVVGESGCGKTVTAQAVMRLTPIPPGEIKGGKIFFNGKDILSLSEREMQSVRGKEIGMIFQDPMTGLNPTMTVGNQIVEALIKHQRLSRRAAWEKAVEMLNMVEIPNPAVRATQYPHQFSGGMRQRAMIAMALACEPLLLIADEPTTSLDVTIQAQILDLLKELQEKLGMTIILITHNLGVVARLAKDIVVMYAGKVVEKGSSAQVFYNAMHPYTRALLKSVPRLDRPTRTRLESIPGTPPDLFVPPRGCAFAPRCRHTMRICVEHDADPIETEPGHRVSCWLWHKDNPHPPKSDHTNGGFDL